MIKSNKIVSTNSVCHNKVWPGIGIFLNFFLVYINVSPALDKCGYLLHNLLEEE